MNKKDENQDMEALNTECVNEENSEVKILEDKVANLEQEIKSLEDKYLRQLAEFENIRKRLEKEKHDFIKYAEEKIILKFIDLFDNLSRAIDSSNESKDFESLLKGLEIIYNQSQNLLAQEGVEVFNSVGELFDPHMHYAVAHEDNDKFENDYVTYEIQKGYKLKGKVIKPALVKVCKKNSGGN